MSQEVTKQGAILIIPAEGYSVLMYLLSFIFTVLYIQLSYLLSQKQVYNVSKDFQLGIYNVKSD